MSKKMTYSESAEEELNHMYNYTLDALKIAVDSYQGSNVEKAETIRAIEARIDVLEKEFRSNHIKRLNEGSCNAFAGAVFLDLISNFERIGDHATNIAETVINNAV